MLYCRLSLLAMKVSLSLRHHVGPLNLLRHLDLLAATVKKTYPSSRPSLSAGNPIKDLSSINSGRSVHLFLMEDGFYTNVNSSLRPLIQGEIKVLNCFGSLSESPVVAFTYELIIYFLLLASYLPLYYVLQFKKSVKECINTPGTRGWSRLRDRTLALKNIKTRYSFKL